ncbi:primosomal protein N' [Microcella alkalica]|uniref:Probable replication restart protein PriA n=1 Tax=Microcella alkalica TaxID=355930 RepID=A0A839E7F5_9MICO|nr:primosomal protein N' [Microcella alkalica]MBA8847083.1 primosomal protein N' (replication factor Y) [Microcella alkalica]
MSAELDGLGLESAPSRPTGSSPTVPSPASPTAPRGQQRIARVLLDSPLPQLDRLFDYRVPESLMEAAVPGVRVTVPLRAAGRQASGYIVEIADAQSFEGVLSELGDVVSAARVLDPAVYRLIRRAADRAAGTASDLARLVVPTRQVRVEKAWLAAQEAVSTSAEDHAPPQVEPPALTGYAPDAFGRLLDTDAPEHERRIALTAIAHPVEVAGRWMPAAARTLAELASSTIAAGRSAIIAVPDYRDVEHVAHALAALIPVESIARVDAGQSSADRYRGFLRTLEPRPLAILGTRAAPAAPAHELGLIALWDDGDTLMAEQHAPGVHARDLALLRQSDAGCALVLAAHARSTEVQRLVEVGYVRPVAPAGRRRRRITPTAQQVGADGPAAQARIPSTAWRAVREALDAGPVLVQVSRPGYAPRLACTECSETARCRSCRGPLALRRNGTAPSCQWCGALAIDWACATCESTRWRTVGRGSARTADELGRAFPGARIVVSDGDTPVRSVAAGRTVVVATRGAEPVAEGGYRAVLLLDGERMLARESLRVVEDCVRWWCTAAALAAPDAHVLLVGVGGAVAQALALGEPERVAAAELADRRALRFPPSVRVAAIAGEPAAVARASAEVAALEGVDVLGPVELGDERVRAIVRFDYGRGDEVARMLKAALVKAATSRVPRIPGSPPRRRSVPLRVRFDDQEPFDDPGGAPPGARTAASSGRMEG